MKLFTLLSLLLFVSCTITKRHFGPGYHVEWKKMHSNDEIETKKTDLGDLKDEIPKETETKLPGIISPLDSADFKLSENEAVKDELQTFEPSCTNDSNLENDEVRPSLIEQEIVWVDPVDQVDQRKTEPLTWVSMIILFTAGIALGIIAAYGSILFVGAGILITCLMIAMFVCSIISVIRIRRDPDRYKNKGLTYFLFSLSLICLITAALYLIVVGALASMTPMLQGI